MIIGYLSGVFDLFHIGHLNIIKRAKENCDYLIVGVSTDELCMSYKGHNPTIPFCERIKIVESIKYVNKVIPQNTLDKSDVVQKYNVNLIFHGDDAQNLELYKKIEASVQRYGTKVLLLPYTTNVSSTIIRTKAYDQSFHYKSLYDMNVLIRRNCSKIPDDIDFIVGVPKSGLIAASIIATLLNIPILGYESILHNKDVDTCVNAKSWKNSKKYIPNQKYKILLVDDSANSGEAINKVKKMILSANPRIELITLAIYSTRNAAAKEIDLFFEVLEQPRVFEWNLQHNIILSKTIVSASLLFGLKNTLDQRTVFYKNFGLVYNDTSLSKKELTEKLRERGIESCVYSGYMTFSEIYSKKHDLVFAIVDNENQASVTHRDTMKPVLAYYSAKLFE